MSTPTSRVFDIPLPDLPLEAGARIRSHIARGWWWGPAGDLPWLQSRAHLLSEEAVRANALKVVRRTRAELDERTDSLLHSERVAPDTSVPTVLLVHALTGDMRAGGPGGWWEPVIGPGRALDPERVRLLCFNNLGSCYGSSGPADEGFPRREEDARFGPPAPLLKGDPRLDETHLPATITPWDQARAILQSLDALGIERVSLLTGGSLGGMIVLCLAVLAPERFERIAPIAAASESSAWVVGWNHVARQTLLADPGYPHDCERGLELARQLATLTYRAEPGMDAHHGRGRPRPGETQAPGWSSRGHYPIQSYLEHQGAKLRARFDARSYLALLGAMDHHDLSRPPDPNTRGEWGVPRIQASALCVGIEEDQLFPARHMDALARSLSDLGRHAEYAALSSPYGHDGFLIEWEPLDALLRRALALPPGGRTEADREEPRTEVNLLQLGHGTVGGHLLGQIHQHRAEFAREQGTEFRVAGVADTRHLLFEPQGIALEE